MIIAGTPVWFRGAHADLFTIRGTIEEVIPIVDNGSLVGVHRYGVRLENGNYKLVPPDQIKKRRVDP